MYQNSAIISSESLQAKLSLSVIYRVAQTTMAVYPQQSMQTKPKRAKLELFTGFLLKYDAEQMAKFLKTKKRL